VKKLGKPASHGCVRLSPQHASELFTLVADKGLQNTRVVLAGRTPGRSVKAAGPPTSRARQSRSTARSDKAAGSTRPRYGLGPSNDKSYARPNKQGGGLFRRLFKRKQAAE
jgi:L,D-transpeptidase catalytic domain